MEIAKVLEGDPPPQDHNHGGKGYWYDLAAMAAKNPGKWLLVERIFPSRQLIHQSARRRGLEVAARKSTRGAGFDAYVRIKSA